MFDTTTITNKLIENVLDFAHYNIPPSKIIEHLDGVVSDIEIHYDILSAKVEEVESDEFEGGVYYFPIEFQIQDKEIREDWGAKRLGRYQVVFIMDSSQGPGDTPTFHCEMQSYFNPIRLVKEVKAYEDSEYMFYEVIERYIKNDLQPYMKLDDWQVNYHGEGCMYRLFNNINDDKTTIEIRIWEDEGEMSNVTEDKVKIDIFNPELYDQEMVYDYHLTFNPEIDADYILEMATGFYNKIKSELNKVKGARKKVTSTFNTQDLANEMMEEFTGTYRISPTEVINQLHEVIAVVEQQYDISSGYFEFNDESEEIKDYFVGFKVKDKRTGERGTYTVRFVINNSELDDNGSPLFYWDYVQDEDFYPDEESEEIEASESSELKQKRDTFVKPYLRDELVNYLEDISGFNLINKTVNMLPYITYVGRTFSITIDLMWSTGDQGYDENKITISITKGSGCNRLAEYEYDFRISFNPIIDGETLSELAKQIWNEFKQGETYNENK